MKVAIGVSQRIEDYRPLLGTLEPDLIGVIDAVERWCRSKPWNRNTQAAWWYLWIATHEGEPVGVTELFKTKNTPKGCYG